MIDVGVDEPNNYALTDIQLEPETLAGSAAVTLRTSLQRLGPAGTVGVELLLEEFDPTRPFLKDGKPVTPPLTPRERTSVDLTENGRQELQFDLGNLVEGVHHGQLRLIDTDGLAADNVRYFTIEVREPWRMLVVADGDTNTSAWTEALAPYELRQQQQASYEITVSTSQGPAGSRFFQLPGDRTARPT